MKEKQEEFDVLNEKLNRLEKKVDMLNNFLNNEFRNNSEELSSYKKNFLTLEIIFYIILGISIIQLVILMIK